MISSEQWSLVDIKPFFSGIRKMWLFKLTYEYTDEKGDVWQIILPAVGNPFHNDASILVKKPYNFYEVQEYYIETHENCNLYTDTSDKLYYVQKVKEAPPKEMTIKRVEELLGYKIKIVDEVTEENNYENN